MITAPIKPEISNSHSFSESKYFIAPNFTEKRYNTTKDYTISFKDINYNKAIFIKKETLDSKDLENTKIAPYDKEFSLSDLVFTSEENLKYAILCELREISVFDSQNAIKTKLKKFKSQEIQELSLDSLISWAEKFNKSSIHLIGNLIFTCPNLNPPIQDFNIQPIISFSIERTIYVEKETKAIALFENIYGKDTT